MCKVYTAYENVNTLGSKGIFKDATMLLSIRLIQSGHYRIFQNEMGHPPPYFKNISSRKRKIVRRIYFGDYYKPEQVNTYFIYTLLHTFSYLIVTAVRYCYVIVFQLSPSLPIYFRVYGIMPYLFSCYTIFCLNLTTLGHDAEDSLDSLFQQLLQKKDFIGLCWSFTWA